MTLRFFGSILEVYMQAPICLGKNAGTVAKARSSLEEEIETEDLNNVVSVVVIEVRVAAEAAELDDCANQRHRNAGAQPLDNTVFFLDVCRVAARNHQTRACSHRVNDDVPQRPQSTGIEVQL